MDEAKLLFHNLNNPENAAINAKERYLAYQQKLKPTTPTSPKVIIPTKKVVLTTQVAQVHVPAQECDNMNTYTKLKVDTCADITILNDPRFFKNGVDTKDTHTLETISLDMGPCTTGVGEAYTSHQLYTDNEVALNSRKVQHILKERKMKPMKNSCEYEPWQNPAERGWRTMTAGAREFLQRGIGDEGEFGANPYWPWAVQQCANVHEATHQQGSRRGHIAHLRTEGVQPSASVHRSAG